MKEKLYIILQFALYLILSSVLISCGGSGNKEQTIVKKDSIILNNNDNPAANNETPDVNADTTKKNTASSNNKNSSDPAPLKVKEIAQVNDNNFTETIKSGVVLVDFWASWCGPCRMQAPILEEVNNEMLGKVTIVKLNIDQNRATTNRFGVINIPTSLIFKNGVQVNQFVGLTEKDELIKALNKEL